MDFLKVKSGHIMFCSFFKVLRRQRIWLIITEKLGLDHVTSKLIIFKFTMWLQLS